MLDWSSSRRNTIPRFGHRSQDTRSEPFAGILMPLCWYARQMEGARCSKMRAAALPWTSTGGRTILQRCVSSRWIWPPSVYLGEQDLFVVRESLPKDERNMSRNTPTKEKSPILKRLPKMPSKGKSPTQHVRLRSRSGAGIV